MKKTLLLYFLLANSIVAAQKPWKVHLIERERKIMLNIDLHEESIMVPGMEMFGPLNGYFGGGEIYGTWVVTSFKIEEDKAKLRLSNDFGSETQEAELLQTSDSTFTLKLTGNVVIKKVNGRKLQKIAPIINMKKK